jgi:ribosome-binding ATPase YchF (GTP1/OBG family)
MGLLTAKPTFYLANVSEEYADEPDSAPGARLVQEMAEEQGLPCVSISVKIEAEINELSEEEAETFRKEMGLPSSLLDRVVSLGYKLLNLITFFTVNENEARAWPIRSGLTAYEAAGKIHSDMQRGFVKAEVTDSGDLFRAGSFARARELGYTRLEGKEYEVRDGDILYIRFA